MTPLHLAYPHSDDSHVSLNENSSTIFFFHKQEVRGGTQALFHLSSFTSSSSIFRKERLTGHTSAAGPMLSLYRLGTASTGWVTRKHTSRQRKYVRATPPRRRLSCTARSSSYAQELSSTEEFRLSRRYRLRTRHFPAAGQGSDGGHESPCPA